MNRRQKKKKQKQRLQQKYNNYSSSYNELVKKDETNRRRRNRRHELRLEKIRVLEEHGVDFSQYRIADIDKLRVKDFNNIFDKRYPWGFVDYNKTYTLKDGESMLFGYRDYSGEIDIRDILKLFSGYTNDKLMNALFEIVNMPMTYSKLVKTGSSGKAGDYIYFCGRNVEIFAYKDEYKKKITRRWQTHKAFTGYQIIKNGNRDSFRVVTPRGLLIIINAIMWNVTEMCRGGFYNRVKSDIRRHLPDFYEILP